jgi:hypothetical protein
MQQSMSLEATPNGPPFGRLIRSMTCRAQPILVRLPQLFMQELSHYTIFFVNLGHY